MHHNPFLKPVSLGVLIAGTATLLISGPQDDQPVLFAFGLTGYVITSPIILFVHDNGWAPFSLLLRAIGPALVLGGYDIIGTAIEDDAPSGVAPPELGLIMTSEYWLYL